jgi:hypothetical protein
MQQASLESIYREIELLPDIERDKLFDKIKRDYYQNNEIIAYTTNGEALTIEQYVKRVNTGIEQCINGESIDFEELTTELGYNNAKL